MYIGTHILSNYFIQIIQSPSLGVFNLRIKSMFSSINHLQYYHTFILSNFNSTPMYICMYVDVSYRGAHRYMVVGSTNRACEQYII